MSLGDTEPDFLKTLGVVLERISNKSITASNKFYIGVSGGSIVTYLSQVLPKIKTDFSRWKIFFNDERVVPINDADSTFGAYQKNIVGKVPLLEEQFVQIKQGVSADAAAADYIQQMSQYFTGLLPDFDLLLLGMGPDGHTCSLFPGHKLLDEDSVWVAPITDSPKPPLARITITFPVINNAKNCVFIATGAEKAEMLKRIIVDMEDFPATRVKPTSGNLQWIFDKAAEKFLN